MTPETRRIYMADRMRNLRKDPQFLADHAKRVKEWRKKNPVKMMIIRAKRRAKVKGLPFSLREEDIKIPTHCPVLGIPLKMGTKNNPNSPTLDRKDNSKGYTQGNVVVVSWRANTIKGDATVEELRRLADYYES